MCCLCSVTILTTAFSCVSVLLCLKSHSWHVDKSRFIIYSWWLEESNKNPAGGQGLKWEIVHCITIKGEHRNGCHTNAFHKVQWNCYCSERRRERFANNCEIQTLLNVGGVLLPRIWMYACMSGKEVVDPRHDCVSGLEKLAVSFWDGSGCLLIVWQRYRPFNVFILKLKKRHKRQKSFGALSLGEEIYLVLFLYLDVVTGPRNQVKYCIVIFTLWLLNGFVLIGDL